MNTLLKCVQNFRFNVFKQTKHLSIYPALRVKEIQEKETNNELVISGKILESGREPYLLKNEHPEACPVCASGLQIKHTDVLILSQFMRSTGGMLPRRITGLCRRSQKYISSLVIMANKAGLMPHLKPANSHKDPKMRRGWKKYNKYFYESTIKIK
ncbi:unnamed protein product [Phyllotreta striolata]|uniref:Ribosomal protein S18 n=1 Tax=Phyllotreta striolata TaxID=444603 RepID=A0A9N9TUE8_PHYSR|nr:unnamed protein product [Phyllotreta striolata]